ncbi:hypothetical protein SDC9_195487 [bioreactor metagenome]|uniref:Uncharacterized protein n=1 Tax=bioreactor metagenome TaxID=1076179 RepID=A0A645IKN3_9ZZZZ
MAAYQDGIGDGDDRAGQRIGRNGATHSGDPHEDSFQRSTHGDTGVQVTQYQADDGAHDDGAGEALPRQHIRIKHLNDPIYQRAGDCGGD